MAKIQAGTGGSHVTRVSFLALLCLKTFHKLAAKRKALWDLITVPKAILSYDHEAGLRMGEIDEED